MQFILEPPFDKQWKTGYLQIHPNGRKYVCLYNTACDRTIISYARYLMSVKIGQHIPAGYEVDHKDNDKTNDEISNLQIVTDEYNRLKEQYRYALNEQVHYGFICAYCETPFLLSHRDWSMRMKSSKTGLAFCSHSCSLAFLPKPISEISTDIQSRIKDLRNNGYSSYKIADSLGIARNTVMKYW